MERGDFPVGLKVGDFIQTVRHFGDIFFEVLSVMPPIEDGGYWHITFARYGKYSGSMGSDWVNSAGWIRRVVPAEMAVSVMVAKHQRFQASFGQYDPCYGFAPRGTPLRQRGD